MTDITGAEKKLRQASFFQSHLARPPVRSDQDPEHVEFYFSACLSAAQSVYYVLDETGQPAFGPAQQRWRAALPEAERSRFGRMIGLRDRDVHLASTGAEPLTKYVPEDHRAYTITGPLFYRESPSVEMANPDGTKVSGQVLRGVCALYIEQGGRRVDAAEACREFIAHLRSLVEAIKALDEV